MMNATSPAANTSAMQRDAAIATTMSSALDTHLCRTRRVTARYSSGYPDIATVTSAGSSHGYISAPVTFLYMSSARLHARNPPDTMVIFVPDNAFAAFPNISASLTYTRARRIMYMFPNMSFDIIISRRRPVR